MGNCQSQSSEYQKLEVVKQAYTAISSLAADRELALHNSQQRAEKAVAEASALRANVKQLQAKLSAQTEQYEAEMKKLKAYLRQRAEEVLGEQRMIECMKNEQDRQCDKLYTMEVKTERLTKEYVALSKSLEKNSEEAKKYKASVDLTLSTMEEEKATLEEAKGRLEQEKDYLEEEKNRLEGERELREEENKRLGEDNRRLQEGKRRLMEKLESIGKVNQRLEGETKRYAEEVRRLESDNKQLKSDDKTSREWEKCLRKEIERLEAQKIRLDGEKEELARKLNQTILVSFEAQQNLQAAHQKTKEALDAATRQIEDLDNEKRGLRHDNARAILDSYSHRKAMQELEIALDEMKKELNSANQRSENLRRAFWDARRQASRNLAAANRMAQELAEAEENAAEDLDSPSVDFDSDSEEVDFAQLGREYRMR